METKNVSEMVDSWIIEEDFPVNASLKPIRQFDGLAPEDEEERQAYYDFVSWYLMQEYLPLQDIPKSEEDDLWPVELDEFGEPSSAESRQDKKALDFAVCDVVCQAFYGAYADQSI